MAFFDTDIAAQDEQFASAAGDELSDRLRFSEVLEDGDQQTVLNVVNDVDDMVDALDSGKAAMHESDDNLQDLWKDGSDEDDQFEDDKQGSEHESLESDSELQTGTDVVTTTLFHRSAIAHHDSEIARLHALINQHQRSIAEHRAGLSRLGTALSAQLTESEARAEESAASALSQLAGSATPRNTSMFSPTSSIVSQVSQSPVVSHSPLAVVSPMPSLGGLAPKEPRLVQQMSQFVRQQMRMRGKGTGTVRNKSIDKKSTKKK